MEKGRENNHFELIPSNYSKDFVALNTTVSLDEALCLDPTVAGVIVTEEINVVEGLELLGVLLVDEFIGRLYRPLLI